MSWLDPYFLLFKNGVQLPARRRLSIASGFDVVDDPANDQLILTVPPSGGNHLVDVSADDHTFNGDGSGGAAQIYSQSIVSVFVNSDSLNFDFDGTAVEEGWTVWFDVRGEDGSVVVRDLTDESAVRLSLDTNGPSQVRGIYFDGDNWIPLAVGKGGDGAMYLPTHIVTGVSSYTVDSRKTKDVLILVDTSSVAVTINLPDHDEGRLLFIKNWKATGGVHGITVHRFGGTGRINTVPGDLALGIRDYTVLCSDGIDNWEDLVITGT